MTAFIAILRKKAREHRDREQSTPHTMPYRRRAEAIKAEFCAGVADDVEKLIADEKAKLEASNAKS